MAGLSVRMSHARILCYVNGIRLSAVQPKQGRRCNGASNLEGTAVISDRYNTL